MLTIIGVDTGNQVKHFAMVSKLSYRTAYRYKIAVTEKMKDTV